MIKHMPNSEQLGGIAVKNNSRFALWIELISKVELINAYLCCTKLRFLIGRRNHTKTHGYHNCKIKQSHKGSVELPTKKPLLGS